MPFQPLKIQASSAIDGMTYDAEAQLLQIAYSDGSVWQSTDQIPKPVVDGVLTAASLGRAVNQQIRARFRFRQLV